MTDSVLDRAIDALEIEDSKSLSWGNVFYSYSRYDYEALLESALPDEDSSEVFDGLIRIGAVLNLSHRNQPDRYRTRMGETVSLMVALKQLLPNRNLGESADLVSDFRFVRKPRWVPARDTEVESFIEQLQEKRIDPCIVSAVSKFFSNNSGIRTLSGFQCRAFQNIADRSGLRGTVVSAGTGSGKTLAFYLPIFASLAAQVPSSRGVRVLAVYPRNELLSDQLKETLAALTQFNNVLERNGQRTLSVGAFYGDTPKTKAQANDPDPNRRKKPEDAYRCPTEGCTGLLGWYNEKESDARVSCKKCGYVSDSSLVTLRTGLQRNPPDILLTSIEMLSKHFSNTKMNKLFGFGQGSQLQYVLLDEIHTYRGVTGAQAALLLRRLNFKLYKPVKYVGLSATLEHPREFFASLSGLREDEILVVSPKDDELIPVSSEYLLCLRGDPVSKKALLATSIQTMMLAVRLLDSRYQSISSGRWPPKLFAFSDSLDTKNRLFFKYLDAEGWDWRNNHQSAQVDESLAALRDFDSSERPESSEQGQNWTITHDLGHEISKRDIVGDLNSSENRGVNPDANIVVATASLEVGFNDPEVGAVLQHQAPRDSASYLQRKGRAGRRVSTRPWMFVVLSEFGRDRELFLRYEELSSPVIPSIDLPLNNLHVLRIQGAATLVEWLGIKTRNLGGRGWIYDELSRPASFDPELRRECLSVLSGLLRDRQAQEDFIRYLGGALGVRDQTILDQIVWGVPRGVFTECVPSLARELEMEFSGRGSKTASRASPVPEFIPAATFKELNVPEVRVVLPSARSPEERSLPFFKAIREYAPGRISKRYSSYDSDSIWVIPNDFDKIPEEYQSERAFIIERSRGDFSSALTKETSIEAGEGVSIPVIRPLSLLPVRAPITRLKITDKSHSQLDWKVEFRTTIESESEKFTSIFSDGIDITLTPYLHAHGCPLEVVRYASSCTASFTTTNKDTKKVCFNFVDRNGSALAIGASHLSDALCFETSVSKSKLIDAKKDVLMLLYRRLLTHRFGIEHPEISVFSIDWLVDCFLTFLLSEVIENERSVDSFLEEWSLRDSPPSRLSSIPEGLFYRDSRLDDEDDDSELVHELRVLLDTPEVFRLLNETAREAIAVDTEKAEQCLLEIFRDTLGGTLLKTAGLLDASIPDGALVVDVEYVVCDETVEIRSWLSEVDPGGNGYLQNLFGVCMRKPKHFARNFVSAVEPSDTEKVGNDIHAIVSSSSDCLERIRNEPDFERGGERKSAIAKLCRLAGVTPYKTLLTALNTRVLRPGSDGDTDIMVATYYDRWFRWNATTGIEWSLTQFAYAHALWISDNPDEAQINKRQILSLLNPSGFEVRQNTLNYYNPFKGLVTTDRCVLRGVLGKHGAHGFVCENIDDLLDSLGSVGSGTIRFSPLGEHVLQLIARIQSTAIESRGLLFYPQLTGVLGSGGVFDFQFEIQEVMN